MISNLPEQVSFDPTADDNDKNGKDLLNDGEEKANHGRGKDKCGSDEAGEPARGVLIKLCGKMLRCKKQALFLMF